MIPTPSLRLYHLARLPCWCADFYRRGRRGSWAGRQGGGSAPRAHTFGETVATQGKDKEKEASAALLAAKKKELVRLKNVACRLYGQRPANWASARTSSQLQSVRSADHMCMSASMNCLRTLITAGCERICCAEGANPKEDLMKLILKKIKWPEPQQAEPAPEPEPAAEQSSPVSAEEQTAANQVVKKAHLVASPVARREKTR